MNETQKNPNVASALGHIMCSPGTRALVLGAGSGSEVVGLARVGVNVVGVERDARQFQALTQRVTAEAATSAEALKKLAEDEKQIALLGSLSARFTRLHSDTQGHFEDAEETAPVADEDDASEDPASSQARSVDPLCPVCGEGVSRLEMLACARMQCAIRTLHPKCVTECKTCHKLFCAVGHAGDHGC